jgi:hypothetical protein
MVRASPIERDSPIIMMTQTNQLKFGLNNHGEDIAVNKR